MLLWQLCTCRVKSDRHTFILYLYPFLLIFICLFCLIFYFVESIHTQDYDRHGPTRNCNCCGKSVGKNKMCVWKGDPITTTKTIFDVVVEDGRFNTLVAALEIADLVDVLSVPVTSKRLRTLLGKIF